MSDVRRSALRHGLRLEYLTVGWNLVEGIVAVTAAIAAGSVALLGFGVDSFVESASGGVLIWRLRREAAGMNPEDVEVIERRAERLVALSFALLALYVTADAIIAILNEERPEASAVGIAVTALSLAVMGWLARAKQRAARALESRALAADAVQTWACLWLSGVVLVGVGLNALFGWWWADPGAALLLSVFLLREAREAWEGEELDGESLEER
jgi:divalent metal cation (Fe/Co/Zn/Cd) transporter